MSYYIGDTIRLTATFKDFDGVLTNPTTITLKYQVPAGTITTSTYNAAGWAHPSTGVYTFDFEVLAAGNYGYSFEGTGTVDRYNADGFSVFARPF